MGFGSSYTGNGAGGICPALINRLPVHYLKRQVQPGLGGRGVKSKPIALFLVAQLNFIDSFPQAWLPPFQVTQAFLDPGVARTQDRPE